MEPLKGHANMLAFAYKVSRMVAIASSGGVPTQTEWFSDYLDAINLDEALLQGLKRVEDDDIHAEVCMVTLRDTDIPERFEVIDVKVVKRIR